MAITVVAAVALAVSVYQSTHCTYSVFGVGDVLENSGSASEAPPGGSDLLETLFGRHNQQLRHRRLPQKDSPADLDTQGALASGGFPAPLPDDPPKQGDVVYYEDVSPEETAQETKIHLVPPPERKAVIPSPKYEYKLNHRFKTTDDGMTLKERNRTKHFEQWKDQD